MNGIPCPNCKNVIALDLTFIIKNPVCTCSHCYVILDFRSNANIMDEYRNVLTEIERIKKESKGITFH